MNKMIQHFGKHLFYLLLVVAMVACSGEDDNPTPALTSDFTFAADPVTPGKVNFTNTSANATGYVWDFGDGNTSTLASPSHTYTSNGTFQVTLMANGATASGGKLPGRSSGKMTTKPVAVANAIVQPAMTASMVGANPFTYTAVSVTATRNSNNIIVRGTSSSGVSMEIRIPANATSGTTYSVAPQQPLASKASIIYTNSTGSYIADVNGCSNAIGSVKVTNVSASSITGTFSGEVFNPSCNGYFTINNASFTGKF